ncbi:alpha/beta hydrolase [Acinetobacter sp. 194]|uniref:alpha/beta hydrolase n=1 Tax=Acinetobacter shaoyimingii TaxID=2715164 RepID=UPI00140B587D|nr:alpha/beta hydrolase [Acinetobacter shaoyimingii]NHB59238.1 alpha/beta hydrolase [Acinetobacter shaoyimingii]
MKRGFLVTILLIVQSFAYGHPPKEKSYNEQQAWKDLQQFLPEHYRIHEKNQPQEAFWSWKNNQIHLDYYPRPNSTAKVILLHGVGTNGRQMSLILGQPLAAAGYETIALDLPGYGLTQYPNKKDIRYEDWVQLVSDFVDAEAQKDARPIFLYGLSAGGMLTLHVAMQNQNVKGIIGMTFLDQRDPLVKSQTMRFSSLKPVLLPGMKVTSKTVFGNIAIPMSWVSKMNTLTNNHDALNVMLKDKTSAGNSMSIRFLNSYMNYQPKMEISAYKQAPVLLTQPAEDRWTPLDLSEPVLEQLKVPTQVVMLPKGSHYPTEAEALEQLRQSSIQFIQKNLN